MKSNPITFALLVGVIALLIFGMLGTKPDDPLGKVYASFLAIAVPFFLFSSGLIFATRGGSETKGPAERTAVLTREFTDYVAGNKGGKHPRVLVVVDNLDRLPGDDAVRALSEIRSLVEIDHSRCIFLIPVDRSALVGHIKGALEGTGSGGDAKAAAKAYLDKFFNLDLVLTEPEPIDIGDWARKQAKAVLPEDDPDDFRQAVGVIARAAGSSPRTVKRVLNGVSSRHRLLDPAARPTLTQVAFVESLLTLHPALLPWLTAEPRHFIAMREQVRTAVDVTGQEAAIAERRQVDGIDRNDLRKFLVDFRDIELDVATLRLTLSLRPDREWLGVSDPSALRPALWSGDAAAFRAAFDATPPAEREAAVERAADRIERSAEFFVRDALAAFAAVVDLMPDYPHQAARVQNAAIAAAITSEPGLRAGLTEAMAAFLFAAPHWRSRELATSIVGALEAAVEAGDAGPGLIAAIQLGADRLSEQDLNRARQALAKCADEAQAALFTPDVDVRLVQGPVAEAHAARAAGIEIPNASAEVLTSLRDLAAFREAGGSPGTALGALATQLTAQLGAFPGDLPKEALDAVELSAVVLRGVATPEVDAYAASLESRGGAQREVFLAAVFSMNPGPPRITSTAKQMDAWLSEGATPDGARFLLSRHREALDGADSEWEVQAVKRWIGRREVDWAGLVRDFSSDPAEFLVGAPFAATPAAEVGPRFAEAVDALEANVPALSAMADKAAAWMAAATPVTAIGLIGPGLARIDGLGVPLDAISQAIADRASALSSLADVAALVNAVSQLGDAGVPTRYLAASELTTRSVAVGVVDASGSMWLAAHSPDKAGAAKLVADSVRSVAIPISAAVALASAVRATLDRKAAVALALAERAADPSTDEPDARLLLEEARRWRPQPPTDRSLYEGHLSSIARRWPTMDGLVNELKGVGKRH